VCFGRRAVSRVAPRAFGGAPQAAESGIVAEQNFALSFVEDFAEAIVAVKKAGKRT
jgi:hypothetical protein